MLEEQMFRHIRLSVYGSFGHFLERYKFEEVSSESLGQGMYVSLAMSNQKLTLDFELEARGGGVYFTLIHNDFPSERINSRLLKAVILDEQVYWKWDVSESESVRLSRYAKFLADYYEEILDRLSADHISDTVKRVSQKQDEGIW